MSKRHAEYIKVTNDHRNVFDRIFIKDIGGTYRYLCVEIDDEPNFKDGLAFTTYAWKYVCLEKEKIHWDYEDFKKNKVTHLECIASKISYCIRVFYDAGIKIEDGGSNWFHYDDIAKYYTLPDGTELYKEVEGD